MVLYHRLYPTRVKPSLQQRRSLASLEGEHDTLVAQVKATHQALLFELELLGWEYNRNLAIISGAFLLVLRGLGRGFGISIHRLRKTIG